jgi:hypothetical protein
MTIDSAQGGSARMNSILAAAWTVRDLDVAHKEAEAERRNPGSVEQRTPAPALPADLAWASTVKASA